MKLKIILLWVLIFIINPIVNAQKISKKELVGEWHLVKLKLDTVEVFDLDNIDAVKKRNIEIIRNQRPDYTEQDSIREIERIDESVADIKKIFFLFNKDNSYSNRVIKTNGRIGDEVEIGIYKLDTKEDYITLKDYKGVQSNLRIELKDDLLTMMVLTKKKKVTMIFRKING